MNDWNTQDVAAIETMMSDLAGAIGCQVEAIQNWTVIGPLDAAINRIEQNVGTLRAWAGHLTLAREQAAALEVIEDEIAAQAVQLAETDAEFRGFCPECGKHMWADDELHTWTDGVSDCHEGCCPDCKGEGQ